MVIETYTREQKAKDQETEKLAAKEREEKEWLDKVFEELAEDKKVELKAEARRRAKEQSPDINENFLRISEDIELKKLLREIVGK